MGKKTIIRKNKNAGLDKGTREEFSLKNFFFMEKDKKEKTERMIAVLKKRKVFISKARLKQILDERKKKSFLN